MENPRISRNFIKQTDTDMTSRLLSFSASRPFILLESPFHNERLPLNARFPTHHSTFPPPIGHLETPQPLSQTYAQRVQSTHHARNVQHTVLPEPTARLRRTTSDARRIRRTSDARWLRWTSDAAGRRILPAGSATGLCAAWS